MENARNTFEVALEAARLANPLIRMADGRDFMFVPDGMKLQDVTDPDRLPRLASATVCIDEKQSMIDYLKRFALPGTILLADFDSLSVAAFIDYHEASKEMKDPGAVGADRHRAVFSLRPSEEWTRWDGFEGEMHPQAEFAAFLEENAVDILEPESATMIEISRDLDATQGVTFKSSTRLESGDRCFTYENETHVKGDLLVPQRFKLSIPLYQGEGPVELEAALRFRVTGGGLLLGFEWRRVEYQRLAYFRAIASEIVEATGVPVFFGRRSAGIRA
jgi:uncharacterized protein YfdQ (DUF2303 family)